MKIPKLIIPPNATTIEQKVCEYILDTPAPGKRCARNALHHLKRAWEIHAVDPEMAIFRGITSEEEAATAIFHALRRRQYAGAEKLDRWSHVHKAAVRPFLAAVQNTLAISGANEFKPSLEIHEEERRLKVAIEVEVNGEHEGLGISVASQVIGGLPFCIRIQFSPGISRIRSAHVVASNSRGVVDSDHRRWHSLADRGG